MSLGETLVHPIWNRRLRQGLFKKAEYANTSRINVAPMEKRNMGIDLLEDDFEQLDYTDRGKATGVDDECAVIDLPHISVEACVIFDCQQGARFPAQFNEWLQLWMEGREGFGSPINQDADRVRSDQTSFDVNGMNEALQADAVPHLSAGIAGSPK